MSIVLKVIMFNKSHCLFLLLILNATTGNTKTFSDLKNEIDSAEKDQVLIILSNYENDLLEWNQEDQGRYYTLKGLNLENSNIELAEQTIKCGSR